MSLYSDTVLADAPNGYWRLDDTSDSANLAGSLTANGSPASTTGLLAADNSVARDLNGSSMYYTAADGTNTDLTDTFTLELWFRADSVTSGYFLSKGTGAYEMGVSGGTIFVAKRGSGNFLTSSVTVSTGQTYHLVVTKDGSTRALYINGVDRTNLSSNQTCANNSTSLFIGASPTPNAFFDGVIDEVAIYPTALSAARVAAHYQTGSISLLPASTDALSLSIPTPDSLSLGAA